MAYANLLLIVFQRSTGRRQWCLCNGGNSLYFSLVTMCIQTFPTCHTISLYGVICIVGYYWDWELFGERCEVCLGGGYSKKSVLLHAIHLDTRERITHESCTFPGGFICTIIPAAEISWGICWGVWEGPGRKNCVIGQARKHTVGTCSTPEEPPV